MSTETTPLLFGRSREVARVTHAIRAGRPVLIVGEPGVGKTALARAGARTVNRPRVWEGGGIATLDWVSYLPYRRALGLDLPDGESSVVSDFLAEHADGGIFIVDDLQWVDYDTVTATLLLAARIPVIAVTRPVPRGHTVQERLVDAGFEVIELSALTEADAASLAAAQNTSLTMADAISVARRANGNPLLIQGLAHASDDTSELALALRARLSDLSVDAREALHRVAVLERPARLEIAAPDLRQLLEMGLVSETPEGVQVRHALIADAVLDDLAPDQLRDVHRSVAQHLDDPGEGARHWAAAGEPERARALALQAAKTANRPAERARCAALAATCLDGPGRDHELVVAMGRLAALGDFSSIVELGAEIVHGGEHEPEARRLQARGLFEARDADAAEEALSAGLAAARRLGDERAEVRLRVTAAYHRLWSMEFDADGLPELVAKAQDLDVADAEILMQAAATLAPMWDPPRALELAHRGRDVARSAGHAWAEQESWVIEATTLNNLGRPVEAAEATRVGEAELLAKGYHATVTRLRATRAELLVHACRYDEVLALTEDLLTHPHLLGGNWDVTVWSRALALSDTGAFDAAEALWHELDGRVLPDGAFHVAWTRAEALLARGDTWAALQLAGTAIERASASLMRPQAVGSLARAQWECGLPVGRSEPPAHSPAVNAYAAETDGLLALHSGAPERAVDLLRDAATRTGWRRHELRCRIGLAEALDLFDPAQATVEFRAIAEALRAHGWIPLLQRVEPLLHAPPGGRRLRPSRTRAHDKLTDREHAVMSLVADGFTSRLIADRLGISQPTVETHVRSAMRKLGAKTRAEAAAATRATEIPA
ncbi:MAG: hypothetical protein JHC95_16635 [Solirubrobacteraceae bacterium]|nr:hypothetical protein [Solirubrobacteraceae bacterium]